MTYNVFGGMLNSTLLYLLTYGQRSFAVSGPSIWNDLPCCFLQCFDTVG